MVALIGDPTKFALLTVLALAGGVILLLGALGKMPELSFELGGSTSSSGNDMFDYAPIRLGLAVAGAIVALLLTRWPVAAIYAAGGGFILPTLVLAKRRRQAAIERLEAIAVWVESLRDTMAASAGLQQALKQSATVAPASIREEVRDLVVRMQHQSTSEALRRFASDVRHPLADMVVAALILATSRHAGSLQPVLSSTASAARDTAAMWRQVESGRTRMYSQAKMAGWVTGGMMVFLVLTRRQLFTAYEGVLGQLVLTVVLGIYVASCFGIYRLGRPIEARRVFAQVENWSDIEGRVLR